MGVACQILISKTREGVHKAGEPVIGIVKYTIDEETEYQDVILSFIGKGKCQWTRRSGKHSRTYRGKEYYINRHVNILNKKPEEAVTLCGAYEYPFEFYLPEDLPSSYKDNHACISYRVQLKFIKTSFFSFNKVFRTEVPVYGFISPISDGPTGFGLEKILFSMFQKPVVTLKGTIDKVCLTPGENAQLFYAVTNDTDVVITSVKTDLYCYSTYTSEGGTTKREEGRIQLCEMESESISERTVREITCTLPTLPELYSIQNSKVFSKEYRVKVTVRLPLPHWNAVVEVPIAIGERKGSVDVAIEALEGEPPSYWQAVCVEKQSKK